jgi:hypothetical protein
MIAHRRLLAIGLGIAALAVAGCGNDDGTSSGGGAYSPPPDQQPVGYDGGYDQAAADLEAQRQAVEALQNITQYQYDAGMSQANNFTP